MRSGSYRFADIIEFRLQDLTKLRVNVRRAMPFITTVDHNPHVQLLDAVSLRDRIAPKHAQLNMFDILQTAITGEL